ncbi:hypothetical protein AFCDBAGC_3706 [Methylobacterium cerastii]|uniref:Uncharacterized protein n=1 Tax=Methylobacterium cerastii TaxID=932741 RepID=A0ABQ4QM47_9HYPH|nr:hypothetical protein AFCDBAGC_3706 [Methylobacterium cerastii]
MPPTAASKSSAICRIPALRCASAASRASAVSASSLRVRIRFSLNTWTADAIAPSSLRSPVCGTSTVVSPATTTSITRAIRRTGAEIVETDIQPTATVVAATRARTTAMARRARSPNACATAALVLPAASLKARLAFRAARAALSAGSIPSST